MTSEEYIAELERRHNIRPLFRGAREGGNMVCTDPNQTHYEIPDPRLIPDAARADILELVSSRIGQYALGY